MTLKQLIARLKKVKGNPKIEVWGSIDENGEGSIDVGETHILIKKN